MKYFPLLPLAMIVAAIVMLTCSSCRNPASSRYPYVGPLLDPVTEEQVEAPQ